MGLAATVAARLRRLGLPTVVALRVATVAAATLAATTIVLRLATARAVAVTPIAVPAVTVASVVAVPTTVTVASVVAATVVAVAVVVAAPATTIIAAGGVVAAAIAIGVVAIAIIAAPAVVAVGLVGVALVVVVALAPGLAAPVPDNNRVELVGVVAIELLQWHPVAVLEHDVLLGIQVVVAIDFGNVVILRAVRNPRAPGRCADIDSYPHLGLGSRSGQQGKRAHQSSADKFCEGFHDN